MQTGVKGCHKAHNLGDKTAIKTENHKAKEGNAQLKFPEGLWK